MLFWLILGQKKTSLVCLFMKKENKFSCLFGQNIISNGLYQAIKIICFKVLRLNGSFNFPQLSQLMNFFKRKKNIPFHHDNNNQKMLFYINVTKKIHFRRLFTLKKNKINLIYLTNRRVNY